MLIRLSPMPDELDRGYFGRLMRLNGIKKETAMVEYMKRMFGLTSRSKFECTRLELLSLMAGMSLEQFAHCHTTLPIRALII